ncbi:hypothetical protein [Nocardia asteroides]|jgi:hypothetical protein|uniref:Uncharacterized protein n=1 Tax=Nocardia asteroides NBRC 15531 TaxID=1110697 RepID=U5EFC3_NOCAS|nr:hypothetical protein [Nocardia asteroides]TLF62888.1 hypothetical protein FEK33_28295 [Nocardia asteroides NBRC 15531]UGT46557.1 hypothetical protein LT345_18560 [Nocardia asteroides]SFN52983.1 hypothetical protein SAMN05444423_11065 [Nocardia asteroides]VEG34609.1 Uncharacterised protein [Nocardia asteroides]GAD85086.1 hypothetical protein NCAST_26_00640 [Nocardia asteroides NBRC 15531]
MLYPSHQGAQDGRLAAPSQQHYGPGQLSAASALTSFVTYAKEVQDLDAKTYPDEYAAHCDRIRQLEPMLRVHGILDVMEIRNPEIAALLKR